MIELSMVSKRVRRPWTIGHVFSFSKSFTVLKSVPFFWLWVVATFFLLRGLRGLLGPNPVFLLNGRRPGYILDESPVHCRTLTDWRQWLPQQGANCTSGTILGFSILLKDTSTCSSVPPQGSRDSNQQSSDHQLYPLSYSSEIITVLVLRIFSLSSDFIMGVYCVS